MWAAQNSLHLGFLPSGSPGTAFRLLLRCIRRPTVMSPLKRKVFTISRKLFPELVMICFGNGPTVRTVIVIEDN